MKNYIYVNSQLIALHTGDNEAYKYFYLHYRPSSERPIIYTSDQRRYRLGTFKLSK
ncbi:MAG: hypothetical protein GWN67_27500 [Phycisphaerae bacterium]|nr:hypothetical protein [Phycisphaerae bacterium]NIP56054.1 hypothetical protein [Phycisphaerae bacterium]NIS50324.1 hypothetical protein [Phycisphaerae bacterium]NIU08071.1 hypothetical protein [Phycisphaerae bacterium]NIU59970.1 hypothetical protein [Phycisphaerae bacterium]